MDDALDMVNYLPISFKTRDEQEYISYLWQAFEENYEDCKYQFAFLAYHMLMMSFVYFSIWRIRQSLPDDFAKGLIGFARDDEKSLFNDASPFTFSSVGESTIFQLYRLIGCDDSQIGNYKKLVKDRNNAAHANGHIYFRTQSEIDAKVRQVLRVVEEIQSYSQPIIRRCYEEFLLQSHDSDKREYPDTGDQIREVLVHGNYMSRKDIELCARFDIAALDHHRMDDIEELHDNLREAYLIV